MYERRDTLDRPVRALVARLGELRALRSGELLAMLRALFDDAALRSAAAREWTDALEARAAAEEADSAVARPTAVHPRLESLD